jgi:adenosine kinase
VQGHDVSFTPSVSPAANATTTCVAVLTTPDKERSFAFTKGTAYDIVPEDVDQTLVEQAKITYLDAYLWLSSSGKDTVHHAAEVAKQAGGKVAIALNDADIVKQNQKEFLALARSHGDILVGDQREFSNLFGAATFEETLEAVKELGVTASITAGAKGAYVVEDGQVSFVPSNKVKSVVDTNGAGDQFAAGFLYGLAQGKSAIDAGRQGAHWASDVIQHTGAEPRVGKNAVPVAPSSSIAAPKRQIG